MEAFLSASVIPAVVYTTAHPTTPIPVKNGHALGISRTSPLKKPLFAYGMLFPLFLSRRSRRVRVRRVTVKRARSNDARASERFAASEKPRRLVANARNDTVRQCATRG